MTSKLGLLFAFVILGCFALAAFDRLRAPHAPTVATTATKPPDFTVDERAAVLAACGAPAATSESDAHTSGNGAKQSSLKYPKVELLFLRTPTEPPTLTGAFGRHSDDALDASELAKLLPCTRSVHFAIGVAY